MDLFMIEVKDCMTRRLVVMDTEGVLLDGYYLISAFRYKGVFPFFQFLLYAILYKLRIITFSRTLHTVYSLLRGMPRWKLTQAFSERPMMHGIPEAIQQMKNQGFTVAIVSSGIPNFLMEILAKEVGAHYGMGIKLHFRKDVFTGRISGHLAFDDGKAQVVRLLGDNFQFPKEEIISVSNDRNNLVMFPWCQINIAFNPDLDMRRKAPYIVNGKDLRRILPLIIPHYRYEPGPLQLKEEIPRKFIQVLGLSTIILWESMGPLFVIALILSITMIYSVSEILRIDGYHLPVISEFTLKRAREEERDWFIASPIYFAFGILAALSIVEPPASFIGIFALSIGDTFSTLCGIQYGQRNISYNAKKSWEGTLGATGILAIFLFIPLGFIPCILISFMAAIIETLPLPINDNLTLPILTAWLTQYVIFPLLPI